MELNTNEGLSRKIDMAKNFLDSANLLERTAEYIFKISSEEGDSKRYIKYNRKLITHYLYSVIFELCIKIIWEIEHNKPHKHTHDIFSLYNCLSKESRQVISDLYAKQVNNAQYMVLLSKRQADKYDDKVNITLQTLEDALKSNAQTVRDFKYDGIFNGKSSVLCSIMYEADTGAKYVLPKPEYIVFPKLLLDYAMSLKK